MTKIKFFKMSESNGPKVTEFLKTVNVTQDGFLVGKGLFGGVLGILYREKGDFGMERDQFAIAISGELAKAQKQYILQEGLMRAHEAMVDLFTGRMIDWAHKIEARKAELANIKGDEELQGQVDTLKSNIQSLEAKHKKAPQNEKEAILKEIFDIGEELKPLQVSLDKEKAMTAELKNGLEKIIGELTVERANLSAEVKQNQELYETAKKDREHAKVFIHTSNQLIKEIKSGEVEEAINNF